MLPLAAKLCMITHLEPRNATSDKYRALRLRLENSLTNQGLKVIMLSSAVPSEGKTTTAINLAITYAQVGCKVLLIDTNLFKPAVHHVFSIPNNYGLINVMGNQIPFQDAIQHANITNLSILTSGTPRDNQVLYLDSHRLKIILQEAKSQYDVVIVDSPALLAAPEAQMIASLCDGVVVVVQYGLLKRQEALEAKQLLEQFKVNLVGVVLNKTKKTNQISYSEYSYTIKKGDHR
jgi:capsular exopolysaccharide synthesis family protein